MTNRLFIALEIPSDVISQIISIRDSVYGIEEKVRWEPKEKLHITLKFLGDTEAGLTKSIISSLKNCIKDYSLPQLEFEKFGMFYREKNPSILWLGLKKNIQLTGLYENIENALAPLGFRKESREFKPHLTILRIKGNENFAKLEELKSKPGLELKFDANKIILFKSTLLKSGSVYEEVESFLLK